MRRTTMLMLVGLTAAPLAQASSVPRLAVTELEIYDTSGQPPQPEQDARLRQLTAELRDSLESSGRYVVVALPTPAGVALQHCNGCEVTEAARAGTDFVMTGLVQKVSSLILNLTLTLREVPSGAVQGSWTADFRGNTDESWQRALRWLLRNRILVPADKDPVSR